MFKMMDEEAYMRDGQIIISSKTPLKDYDCNNNNIIIPEM